MPTTAPSSFWIVTSSESRTCGVNWPVALASSVIAPSSSATPRLSMANAESAVSMRAFRLKARGPSRSTVPLSVAPRSGAVTATRVTAAVSVRASTRSGPKCRASSVTSGAVTARSSVGRSTVPPSVARPSATTCTRPAGAPSAVTTPGSVVPNATPVIWKVPASSSVSRVQARSPAMRPSPRPNSIFVARTASLSYCTCPVMRSNDSPAMTTGPPETSASITMRARGPESRPVALTTPVTGAVRSKRLSHDSTATEVASNVPSMVSRLRSMTSVELARAGPDVASKAVSRTASAVITACARDSISG